jgi:tetratricopeptide (TPR) repeat protein
MSASAQARGGSSACEGRETESRVLREALSRAREGHGATLLLTGPPGIGKTYVLHWLQARAASEGWLVLAAECRERSEVRFAPFEDAFRQLQAPERSGAAAPPGPRLLSYVRTLIAESSKRPCLLLLDDLQWADPESVLAFQVLSRALGGMPAVLIGALRDSFLGAGSRDEEAWSRIVRSLKGEGTLSLLTLEGLGPDAARLVIERALGAPLEGVDGDRLARLLWERTEGNPLYLQELSHQLLLQGHLSVHDGRAVVGPSALGPGRGAASGVGGLPPAPSLRRIVLARLDPLHPADLQLLRAAALAGGPFESAPLSGALQRPPREILASLRSLAEAGILLHQGTEDGEGWQFAHDLLWEVVLREAPEEELRELARRPGAWWSTSRPDQVEVVARFFHEARDPVQGLPWVRDAIDRALSAGAAASAERFFRWYFDLLALASGDPETLSRETLELVDRLLVRRLRHETLGVLEELLRSHPTPELRWEVGWREAHVQISFDVRSAEAILHRLEGELGGVPPERERSRRGQLAFLRCEIAGSRLAWEESIRAGMEAEVLLEDAAPIWQRGRLLYEIAWGMMMLHRYPEAQDLLDEAQELLSKGEAAGTRASLGVLAASLALMHGRLDEAARLFERSGKDLLEAGGMEGYGIAHNDRAEVELVRGDLEAARRALEEAELVGRRFAAPRVLQGCHFRWGWWHALRGEWDLAHACCTEAEQTSRVHGFDEGVWENRVFLRWSEGELGSPGRALVELAPLRKESEAFPAYFRPYVGWVEGRLLDLAGRSGAREALTEALGLARRAALPYLQSQILLSLAGCEERAGKQAEARQHREEAASLQRSRPTAAPPVPGG